MGKMLLECLDIGQVMVEVNLFLKGVTTSRFLLLGFGSC